MKILTSVLAFVSALAVSSCCCQSQPMPKLRPFPKDCQEVMTPAAQAPVAPEAPVKVFEGKGK